MSKYINADELLKSIDIRLSVFGRYPKWDFTEMVNEMPSADVVEVKHGEWIDESDDSLKCSVCGMWVYKPFIGGSQSERTRHYVPNYCAFCGADMRGIENE